MTSEANTHKPYGLTPEQIELLMRGIHGTRIKRDNKGRAHVQAWDVRRWLTRIFGFAGWSTRETSLVCVSERYSERANGEKIVTVVYRCSIALIIKDVYGNVLGEYHGSAAGDAQNFPAGSAGDAHDFALKTADSQAIKRAAMNLGDQFGLSLYNAGSESPVIIKSAAYGAAVLAADEHVGVPEDEAEEAARQIALQDAAAEQTGRGEQRPYRDDRPRQTPPPAALTPPQQALMTRERMQLASVGANTAIPRLGDNPGPRPQAATPNGRARAIVWDVDNVLRNLDDCGEALVRIHDIRQKAITSKLGNDVARVPDRLLDENAVDKQGAPFAHTHHVHEIIDAAGLLIKRLCESSQPTPDALDRRVRTRDDSEDYGGRDKDEREAAY